MLQHRMDSIKVSMQVKIGSKLTVKLAKQKVMRDRSLLTLKIQAGSTSELAAAYSGLPIEERPGKGVMGA